MSVRELTSLVWSRPRAGVAAPASATPAPWQRWLAFAGPGFLVAVGYMDPGNWATDLAGGSRFGYALLSVVLLSSLMAMVLQALSARLGLATGRDLAQNCRAAFGKPAAVGLWMLAEIAIAATDLAEVLGGAIALNLLFGIPLTTGVLLTGLYALAVLVLQHWGMRTLEALVAALIAVIAVCFAYELVVAPVDWARARQGLSPDASILAHREMLYVAVGIIGATVMPHNLYLHSALVQRHIRREPATPRLRLARAAVWESNLTLTLAFFANAAILVLAAAAFHRPEHPQAIGVEDAYRLLSPMLGASLAGTVFALALLAAGLNASVTATLSGQVVMEGFLNFRMPAWLRRIVTRLLALVPALIVVNSAGAAGVNELLILSQVILSLQLPFAVIPLVWFSRNKALMGDLASPRWLTAVASTITLLILAMNGVMLGQVWDY